MSDPLAYSLKDAAAATGVAFNRIRIAVEQGELEVVYTSPKRMVVRRAALEAWLDSLPKERAS